MSFSSYSSSSSATSSSEAPSWSASSSAFTNLAAITHNPSRPPVIYKDYSKGPRNFIPNLGNPVPLVKPKAIPKPRAKKAEKEKESSPKFPGEKKRSAAEALMSTDKDQKLATSKVSRTDNPLQRPVNLSNELAEFVGERTMSHTMLPKFMWAYIKRNNLQDPHNKKVINLDAKMKAVFGIDSFEMTDMNIFLKHHKMAGNISSNSAYSDFIFKKKGLNAGDKSISRVKTGGAAVEEAVSATSAPTFPNWNTTTSQDKCGNCNKKHTHPFFMCSSCKNIICLNECDNLVCERFKEGCWHGSCQDCCELPDRSVEYCSECNLMLCEGCDPCRSE